MVGRIHRSFMSSQIAFAGIWILVAIVVIVIWALMTEDVRHAAEVASDQPRHTVAVARVIETDDDTFEYVVIDGSERRLQHDWALFSFTDFGRWVTYEEGDKVTVVLDPDRPHIAFDVEQTRPFSWWDSVLGLAFIWGIASLIRRYYTRRWKFPERSRWQLMRRNAISTARVLEVRAPQQRPFPQVRKALTRMLESFLDQEPDTSTWLVLIVEIEGRPYAWDIRMDRDPQIEIGLEIPIWGRARHRGWVVGLTQPDVLYPRAPLD
jgi:hypothetical protein